MAIRWDPLLALALAAELDTALKGMRVRALLMDQESRRVSLFLRENTLVFELHPNAGWVSLLPATEPLPDARPLPVKVRGVAALPDESAIVFALPRVRGQDEGVELVVEWVGNRWNAVVLGHSSRVIRHVLHPRAERTRSLTVGAIWRPPASTGRRGMKGEVDREEWERWSAAEEAGSGSLVREAALLSSLNAPAFRGKDGWERWTRLQSGDEWSPVLLRTERGALPYPIALPGIPSEPMPSLLVSFETARAESEGTGPAGSLLLSAELLARGDAQLRRLRRSAGSLRREMARLEDPDPIRARGDLILARFAQIPRGSSRVALTDFEGNEVELDLDPALQPHENAARFYDEAARLERAAATLPGRLAQVEAEMDEWSRLLESVRSGATPSEVLEARLGPATQVREGAGRATPTLPYRRYRSSGGLEIRVGRGSRQNDELTFHHSAPGDVWLHVRQSPGAHVILRWGREGSPPKKDLIEAATLAALNSDARHAGTVPVDWTFRKHLRKPRKAPPGAVIPDRVKTLFVEPDPDMAKRLAER